jgi:hypothetical protein
MVTWIFSHMKWVFFLAEKDMEEQISKEERNNGLDIK